MAAIGIGDAEHDGLTGHVGRPQQCRERLVDKLYSNLMAIKGIEGGSHDPPENELGQ